MKHLDWDNMQKSLEALYVLDDYLTDPSKDYLRLIRKKVTDFTSRYSIDNGAGDSLDVIFTEEVVLKIVSIRLQLTNGIRTLSTGFIKVLMKNG